MIDVHVDSPLNADALEFLRAGLTTAEREWPRFRCELRRIGDVPLGEHRTHPDLVTHVAALAPSQAWMLMGAVVLVSDRGAIYAIGMGTHTVVIRAGADAADGERTRADTPRPPSMGGGRFALGPDWVRADPYDTAHSRGAVAKLKELVGRAGQLRDA
jgi:hypothetical protein